MASQSQSQDLEHAVPIGPGADRISSHQIQYQDLAAPLAASEDSEPKTAPASQPEQAGDPRLTFGNESDVL